jgi:hypothetical protein
LHREARIQEQAAAIDARRLQLQERLTSSSLKKVQQILAQSLLVGDHESVRRALVLEQLSDTFLPRSTAAFF